MLVFPLDRLRVEGSDLLRLSIIFAGEDLRLVFAVGFGLVLVGEPVESHQELAVHQGLLLVQIVIEWQSGDVLLLGTPQQAPRPVVEIQVAAAPAVLESVRLVVGLRVDPASRVIRFTQANYHSNPTLSDSFSFFGCSVPILYGAILSLLRLKNLFIRNYR